MKVFYTSKKYKNNWEGVFGKDERLVAEKDYKDLDSYGVLNWQDLVFMPNSFDNFCMKYNLLDGYSNCFETKENKEKEMELKDKVLEIVSVFCDDVQSFTSLDVSNAVKECGFSSTRHREVASTVRQSYMDNEMDSFGYVRTLISVTLNNGNTTRAFLYHHQSVDPDSYNKVSQIAIVPVVALAPVAIPAPDADDDYSPVKFDPDPDDAQQAFNSALTGKSDDPQQAFDAVLATKQDLPIAVVVASAPRVVNANTTIGGQDTPLDAPLDTANRQITWDGRMEVPATWIPRMGWAPENAIYAILDVGKILLKNDVTQGENVVGTMYVNRDGRIRLTKMSFLNAGWTLSRGHSLTVKRFVGRIEVANALAPTSTFVF